MQNNYLRDLTSHSSLRVADMRQVEVESVEASHQIDRSIEHEDAELGG